jgi:hypothetical protein
VQREGCGQQASKMRSSAEGAVGARIGGGASRTECAKSRRGAQLEVQPVTVGALRDAEEEGIPLATHIQVGFSPGVDIRSCPAALDRLGCGPPFAGMRSTAVWKEHLSWRR